MLVRLDEACALDRTTLTDGWQQALRKLSCELSALRRRRRRLVAKAGQRPLQDTQHTEATLTQSVVYTFVWFECNVFGLATVVPHVNH